MVKRHTEDALDGWVKVGLFLLPGVPLWFVWEDFVKWTYGTTYGAVGLLQFASVLLLHGPVMKALIKLCDQIDALREKRSRRTKDTDHPAHDDSRMSGASRTQPSALPTQSDERFNAMVSLAQEMALADAMQNLRVRTQQHLLRKAQQAEASNARMRFFMMEGFTPALEPKPGSMLLLTDDGSWVPISPREVLADERSPEVSEQKFRAVVAALDCAMPDNPQLGSATGSSRSPKGAHAGL